MLPPQLSQELEELRAHYATDVIEEDAFINLTVAGFPTGPLFNCPTTTLLLRVPRAYPDATMDMFWTEPGLVLATGAVPQCGEVMETYAGRQWRRFSWHHNGWSPHLHTLAAYLDFVRQRFNAP